MPRPPGPPILFALPALFQLLRDPRTLIDEHTRRYGPVWRIPMPVGGRLGSLVWLMGPAGNERILAPQHKDDFSWEGGYGFTMEPIFGGDILILLDDTPAAPAHRERHRMLVPAFHPRLDGEYLSAMRDIAERQVAGCRDGEVVDLAALLKRIAFHIVARLLLGASDDDLPRLTHLFEDVGLGLFTVLRLDLPGTHFHRGRIARRRLGEYLRSQIASYRREGPPANLLGQLLRHGAATGEPLPDEVLVAEMIEMLFAGYDTTASMLAMFFVALSERPDVAASVAAEAASLREESWAALQQQRVLDAALLETERLHPPLVFNLRGVRRSFEFGGYTVRAGDRVAYSSYFTHRMPELYDRAGEFRPERFLDGPRPSPYALLGFGAGHRSCIGKRFAALEMRMVINVVLRTVELEFLRGQSKAVFFNPALQLRDGFRARVRRR